MNICRYCNNTIPPDEVSITHSYWNSFPFFCHRQCKDAGVKQEAFDCQMIDADCNDCKYYIRGNLAPKIVSLIKTIDGRMEEIIFSPNVFIDGRCLKFDKVVIAQPNKYSGLICFEHRRARKLEM